MYKYQIVLTWSEIDQVFVANVPEFPGCTAHRTTQDNALQSVDEAIELWINTAKEIGKRFPKPRERGIEFA